MAAESPAEFNATNTPPITLPNIEASVSGAATSASSGAAALAGSITDDVIADLTAGLAVFTALNDSVGVTAYQAILSELQAIQKATAAQALPKVHVAYDLAILRTLVLAVQPNSPIANAVAPLAQQTAQSVLTIVNGIVTGAAIKIGTAGIL